MVLELKTMVAHAVRNARPYMEDRYVLCRNVESGTHMGAVFDGHGGAAVADLCSTYVSSLLRHHLLEAPLRKEGRKMLVASALVATLRDMDDWALQKTSSPGSRDCGSTACIVVVESGTGMLTVANLGDSRAVVRWDDGHVLQLTRDHKPDAPEERRRIEAEGGQVVYVSGVARTMGNLSLSRALGDWGERPFVSPDPEVFGCRLTRGALLLGGGILIASDGLWDVMSSDEAVNMAAAWIAAHDDVDDDETTPSSSGDPSGEGFAMRALVEEAMRRGSGDNITVVWIGFTAKNLTV